MDITAELQKIVSGRLSVSPSELYCYSSDASQVKGMPDYVVRPKSTDEVSRIVRLAYENEIPVTARGAGTGLAGGAVPVKGGIVLDMSGMNRILEIDINNIQVQVEPGV
ncbi:FAD-binding oxidoreductase, partial [Methanosarcina sp. A14]